MAARIRRTSKGLLGRGGALPWRADQEKGPRDLQLVVNRPFMEPYGPCFGGTWRVGGSW